MPRPNTHTFPPACMTASYRGNQMFSELLQKPQKRVCSYILSFLKILIFPAKKSKNGVFLTLSPPKPDTFGRGHALLSLTRAPYLSAPVEIVRIKQNCIV